MHTFTLRLRTHSVQADSTCYALLHMHTSHAYAFQPFKMRGKVNVV